MAGRFLDHVIEVAESFGDGGGLLREGVPEVVFAEGKQSEVKALVLVEAGPAQSGQLKVHCFRTGLGRDAPDEALPQEFRDGLGDGALGDSETFREPGDVDPRVFANHLDGVDFRSVERDASAKLPRFGVEADHGDDNSIEQVIEFLELAPFLGHAPMV